MNIVKHFNLAIISVKLELMDRMEEIAAFSFITVGSLLRIAVTIIFFKAIYLRTDAVGGWEIGQVYALLGAFFLIEAVAWSTYLRGFQRLPFMIESGRFDLYLSKPVNPRFYLIYRFIDIVFILPQLAAAIGLIIYGAAQGDGMNPAAFIFVLAAAFVIHYSLVVMVASVNFFHILHQTSYLIGEITKLGRYPLSIYREAIRLFLSTVIPLVFIYTLPSRIIYGQAVFRELVLAALIAVIFYYVSKLIWEFSLKRYESAQG